MMQCDFCRAWNPAEEHRCGRCGRRLPGNVIAIDGSLALALPAPVPLSQPLPKPPARAGSAGSLDFLPPAPLPPRRLKTRVDAAISCDAPVATPWHRAVASAFDLAMILVAFGMFLLALYFTGARLPFNRATLFALGAALAALTLFYGFVWTLANCESAGMRWTRLELVSFEGARPDAGQRVLRLLAACVSVGALALGVLWSLLDEEGLAWHDYISRTFPAVRRPETNFFRSS